MNPEILRSQRLPDELPPDEKDIWRGRHESIVNLESHLHRQRHAESFLHLSKEEQTKS